MLSDANTIYEIRYDFDLDGVPVCLFFCKRGHKGNWNGLLTTDLSLSFFEAYRI